MTMIQLTSSASQAGSAWAPCKADLSSDFDLECLVYLGSDWTAADGIAFVFQNDAKGVSALGANGGGLGYGDLTATMGFDPTTSIRPSLDAEIDTNYNDEMTAMGEPVCDHLAVPVCFDASPTPGTVSDGTEHKVFVHWGAISHTLTVSWDTGAVVSYNKDIVNSLFGGTSKVYWGWTGGTGGNSSRQYFLVQKAFYSSDCFPTPSMTHTPTLTVTPTPSMTLSETPVASPNPSAVSLPSGHAFVYPNPVEGKIGHLAYQLESAGRVQVRVYNSAFDLAGKFFESNGPGNHVMDLDLRTAAPGVYYVLVEYEVDSGRKKLSPFKIYLPGHL
jgi:hypothetical protein